MTWRRLNWLSDILLPGAVAAMEVAWLYPLLIVVGGWPFLALTRPILSFWSMLLLTGSATFATRAALRSHWPLAHVRLSVLILALLLILGTVWIEYGRPLPTDTTLPELLTGLQAAPGPLLALFTGVYLFWRGIGWGRSRLYSEDVRAAFVLGLAGFSLLLFFALLSHADAALQLTAATAAASIAAFFALGLSALSLASLEVIRQAAERQEAPALNRQWLGFLTLIVGLIVLGALLLAGLFSFDILRFLSRPLNLLADVLLILVYILLLPVGLLAAVTVYALRFLVALLRGDRPPQWPEPIALDALREPLPEAQTHGLPPDVIIGLKWSLLVLVFLLAVIILMRALFRYWRIQGEGIEEVHESVFAWDEFLNGLLGPFRRLLARFRRPKVAGSAASPAAQPVAEEAATVLTIRELYREFLRWAAAHGMRRPSPATPYEFERQLRRLDLPEPDLRFLTEAYVRARYGNDPPSSKLSQEAQQAWYRLREGHLSSGSSVTPAVEAQSPSLSE